MSKLKEKLSKMFCCAATQHEIVAAYDEDMFKDVDTVASDEFDMKNLGYKGIKISDMKKFVPKYVTERSQFNITRVVIVGDAEAGKSTFLKYYTANEKITTYDATIGIDFGIKMCQIIPNVSMKLQIWDTAGQERFRSITKSYYRGSKIAIVMFDVTDKDAYKNVVHNVEEIISHANNVSILILGNKTDLTHDDIDIDMYKQIDGSVEDVFLVSLKQKPDDVSVIFDYFVRKVVDKRLDELLTGGSVYRGEERGKA